jgi:hypothetical protein
MKEVYTNKSKAHKNYQNQPHSGHGSNANYFAQNPIFIGMK